MDSKNGIVFFLMLLLLTRRIIARQ